MTENIKYYFSPLPTQIKTNEYVNNFCDTLIQKVNLVNYGKKVYSRSIDYFIYSFKSDVAILNWPEDVLFLRYGLLQMIFTCIIFLVYRVRGKKIIWICHNKNTHKARRHLLSKMMRQFFTWVANSIVVHSQDALNYFKEKKKEIYYLPHPVYKLRARNECRKPLNQVDVLIWGNISPYKGLEEFLKYYKEGDFTFSVLIIGKADVGYAERLVKIGEGRNVNVVDHFITDEELPDYFDCCKIIVLPYLDKDTFSSGALIHSLNSGKVVIGPHIGNFSDLNDWQACLTYYRPDGLFLTIKELLDNETYYKETIMKTLRGAEEYYKANSSQKFVDEILAISNAFKSQKPRETKYTLSSSNADS